MFAMADLIVMLWFVPVTLFILVPLAMLCGWSALRLTLPAGGKEAVRRQPGDIGAGGELYSQART